MIHIATPLELDFDLGMEFNLTTMHFWNYWTDGHSFDQSDFILFDGANSQVAMTGISPTEGTNPLDLLIDLANYAFAFNNVRYINAKFSDTNDLFDFNNIGWTGMRSVAPPKPVPLPPAGMAIAGALALLGWSRRRT